MRHQDLCFQARPCTTMIFLSIPDWLTFPPISQGRHYAVIQTEPPQVLLTHWIWIQLVGRKGILRGVTRDSLFSSCHTRLLALMMTLSVG